VGVVKVKAPAGDGQGIVNIDGGSVVELVNINGRLITVNVDGTGMTSGWGISIGGYEERS